MADDSQPTGKRKVWQISGNESEPEADGVDDSKDEENENDLPLLNNVEDALQIQRVAAPQDFAAPAEAPTPTAVVKNSYDALRWILISNNGSPDSLIKLVALKSLFAKQLPKMPRSYIARLVFDRRHTSLAILSDTPSHKDSDEEVIGGICFRAFDDMRFAEIAFCAVSASYQVKVKNGFRWFHAVLVDHNIIPNRCFVLLFF